MDEKKYTQKELDGRVKQAIDNTTRQTLALIARYADQFRDQARKFSIDFTRTENRAFQNQVILMLERVNNLNALRAFLKNEYRITRNVKGL